MEDTVKILDSLNLYWDDEIIISKGRILYYGDLIEAILNHGCLDQVVKHLNIPKKSLERVILKAFPLKPKNMNWKSYFNSILDIRICLSCKLTKSTKEFGKDKSRPSGFNRRCKVCDAAISKEYYKNNTTSKNIYSRSHYTEHKYYYCEKAIRYKLAKINRTPKWADLEQIKLFYFNCPEGHHVDHIIPLQGELVSGLHVLNNLQYLTAFDNLSKSNKFIIEVSA